MLPLDPAAVRRITVQCKESFSTFGDPRTAISSMLIVYKLYAVAALPRSLQVSDSSLLRTYEQVIVMCLSVTRPPPQEALKIWYLG